MQYFERPRVFGDGEPTVLCMANTHPNEWGTQACRAALLEAQPPGVAIVDGNLIAAQQGWRLTNNVPTYGNLATQFGTQPVIRCDVSGASEELTEEQKLALKLTRRRAQELREFIATFSFFVDFHGCSDHHPSLAWLGGRSPTLADLMIAHAINPKMAIVSDNPSTVGALGRGVGSEIRTDDHDAVKRLISAIGKVAGKSFEKPDLSSMQLYKFVGETHDLAPEVVDGLGLNPLYTFGATLPLSVNHLFGVEADEPLQVLAADEGTNIEIIRRMSSEEKDQYLEEALAA